MNNWQSPSLTQSSIIHLVYDAHLQICSSNRMDLSTYTYNSPYLLNTLSSPLMKLNLYIFTSKVELECDDDLNPEELSPYCTVKTYYREEDALHVRISKLKTNLTTVKNELAPKTVKL